jgi:hypothetical protein
MIVFTILIHVILLTQAPPSSVAAAMPVFRWSGDAVIGATTTDRILSRPEFVQVQQAWAVRYVDFALLIRRYKTDVATSRPKPTLKQWKMKPIILNRWTAAERPLLLQMQRMSRKCKVNYHMLLFMISTVTIYDIN